MQIPIKIYKKSNTEFVSKVQALHVNGSGTTKDECIKAIVSEINKKLVKCNEADLLDIAMAMSQTSNIDENEDLVTTVFYNYN